MYFLAAQYVYSYRSTWIDFIFNGVAFTDNVLYPRVMFSWRTTLKAPVLNDRESVGGDWNERPNRTYG